MYEPMWWAFLLKPFFGIAFAAFLLYGSHFIARAIYAVFPGGRVKDYLFLGWNKGRTADRTDSEQRVLDHPPLIGRECRKDAPRL